MNRSQVAGKLKGQICQFSGKLCKGLPKVAGRFVGEALYGILSPAEAVKVAQQADVVVLAIGDNEQTSREAWALSHLGDRASLDLVGVQDELVDAIAATGRPIVAVLFNGRPISIRNLTAQAQTIFECWYLGQEAGRALAEALFGDINPGGKLPITIPRSVGHIPAYYNYKPAARRGYLFDDVTPLYAFGFGLSYTQFRFGKPRLKKSTIAKNESTVLRVDVTNAGPRAGDEVVQMYIRDKVSSVTRPVKELKGFQRITLAPGEAKTVALEIAPQHLAFCNIDMKYVVEPGIFEIMVGNSSRDQDLQKVHAARKMTSRRTSVVSPAGIADWMDRWEIIVEIRLLTHSL